jgi:membrane protein YqaA with SNARE-associated domain
MKELLKSVNIWILKWAETKWGQWALFVCAFVDSSIIGLPTPVLFVLLALMNLERVHKYVLFAIMGTVSGSIAGYAIGHFVWLDVNGEFSELAHFLFNNIPGFSESGYHKIHILYEKWDFGILFLAAVLPLPYKIFSISSGVFDVNLLIFCLATFISQSIKFFLLALMTIKLGPEVRKLIEFDLKPFLIIATASIAIIIVVIKVF